MSKKDNLDAKDLVFGKLITPIKLDSDELTEYGKDNIDYWDGSRDYLRYVTDGEFFWNRYEDILIKKPTLGKIKKHSKATEVLTGEQFDYVITYYGRDYDFGHERYYLERRYKPSRKGALDAYVFIDVERKSRNDSKTPTSENLLEYMGKHVNIEEYRKELQEIKERSLNLRLHGEEVYKERSERQEQDKQKEIKLTENILLLPDILDDLHCTDNVRMKIFEIIKDDSYYKLSTIEDMLKKLRKKYPNLSEEEYISIVSVMLRMNSSTENNKPYLKVI